MNYTRSLSALFFCLPFNLPLVFGTGDLRIALDDIQRRLPNLQASVQKNLDRSEEMRKAIGLSTSALGDVTDLTRRIQRSVLPKKSPLRTVKPTSTGTTTSLVSTLSKIVVPSITTSSATNTPSTGTLLQTTTLPQLGATMSASAKKLSPLVVTDEQFSKQTDVTLQSIQQVLHEPTQEDIIRVVLLHFLNTLQTTDLDELLKDEQQATLVNQRFAELIEKVNQLYPNLNIQAEVSFKDFYEKWKALLSPEERLTQDVVLTLPQVKSFRLPVTRSQTKMAKKKRSVTQPIHSDSWDSLKLTHVTPVTTKLPALSEVQTQNISLRPEALSSSQTTTPSNIYFRKEVRKFSFEPKSQKIENTQTREKTPTAFNLSLVKLMTTSQSSVSTSFTPTISQEDQSLSIHLDSPQQLGRSSTQTYNNKTSSISRVSTNQTQAESLFPWHGQSEPRAEGKDPFTITLSDVSDTQQLVEMHLEDLSPEAQSFTINQNYKQLVQEKAKANYKNNLEPIERKDSGGRSTNENTVKHSEDESPNQQVQLHEKLKKKQNAENIKWNFAQQKDIIDLKEISYKKNTHAVSSKVAFY